MTRPLVLGRIVWAEIPDANGIRKLRPAVIVTPTAQLAPDAPLDVVAITSRLVNPLPEDHVLLPWHAQRHPKTGLNRRCAAVCSWLAQITVSDVQDAAGIVPTAEMRTILAKLESAFRSTQPKSPADTPPQDPPPPTAKADSEGQVKQSRSADD